MGQQDSKSYQSVRIQQPAQPPHTIKASHILQHEGILKLRMIPFKNCTEIQYGNQTLFLQNINTTLGQILEPRLYTNKLFPEEDVSKLIESVVYSLAFLQQNNVYYGDISVDHIFYHDRNFKILPNQLIPESVYELALKLKTNQNSNISQTSNQFIILSPQMIIALRCQQQSITDDDILHKSNVFIFGMIMLEVTTLLPSSECYDHQNYDILDDIVTQRLAIIQQHYGERVARIIGNMIDYDYTERMDLKELAIWINRELGEVKGEGSQERQIGRNKKNINSPKGPLVKSRFININSKVQKTQGQTAKLNPSRTNQVYMNYEDVYSSKVNLIRNESHKNKIYLKDSYLKDSNLLEKEQKMTKTKNEFINEKQHYDYHPAFKRPNLYEKGPESENAKQKNQKNTYKYYPCLDHLGQHGSKDKNGGLKFHQDNPLKEYNKKYPKQHQHADHSITRIKEQIQKSRKLIQEFQKSQGIGHSSKYN